MGWSLCRLIRCPIEVAWNQKEHVGGKNGTNCARGGIVSKHWIGFLKARWCHSRSKLKKIGVKRWRKKNLDAAWKHAENEW